LHFAILFSLPICEKSATETIQNFWMLRQIFGGAVQLFQKRFIELVLCVFWLAVTTREIILRNMSFCFPKKAK
jgi:hypothetical protein